MQEKRSEVIADIILVNKCFSLVSGQWLLPPCILALYVTPKGPGKQHTPMFYLADAAFDNSLSSILAPKNVLTKKESQIPANKSFGRTTSAVMPLEKALQKR